MDVTLNRATVLEELQLIQGVVERRTTIPILSNILLTAEGDRLHLAATDLDVTVYTAVLRGGAPGGARRPSTARCSSISCARFLRKPSTSRAKEARVEVRSGPFNSQLASLDPADFPTLPEVPDGQGFAVDLAVLRPGSSTARCSRSPPRRVTSSTTPPYSCCRPRKFLEMVATDGHRLAWVKARSRFGSAAVRAATAPAQGSQPTAPSQPPRRTRRSTSPAARTTSRSGSATACCCRAFSRHGSPSTSGCSCATTRIAHGFSARSSQPRCGVLRSSRASGPTAFRCSSRRTPSRWPRWASTSDRRQERWPAATRASPLKVFVNAHYLLDFLGAVDVKEVELQLRDADGPIVITPLGEDAAARGVPLRDHADPSLTAWRCIVFL